MIKLNHSRILPQASPRGRPRKYPLPDMAVGDFFEQEAPYQVLYGSIRHYLSVECGSGRKCKTFQIDRLEEGKNLFRVTRVK